MVAPGGTSRAATLFVPYASSSVHVARRHLASDLATRGVGERTIDDAVLVLSEILSNALKHARPLGSGHIRVNWYTRDSVLRLEVTDGGGPTRPHATAPALSSTNGRGLGIVSAVVADWGVRQRGSETTVWATLPIRLGRRRGR